MERHTDPLAALRDKYDIEDDWTSEWHLFCRHCSWCYALKKTSAVSIGNILALLNHAASHDKENG